MLSRPQFIDDPISLDPVGVSLGHSSPVLAKYCTGALPAANVRSAGTNPGATEADDMADRAGQAAATLADAAGDAAERALDGAADAAEVAGDGAKKAALVAKARVNLGGVEVSQLGIGTWAWGDSLFWGYSEAMDKELQEARERMITMSEPFRTKAARLK